MVGRTPVGLIGTGVTTTEVAAGDSSSFESLGRIGVNDSGDEGFIADMQRKVDAPECP